MRVGGGQEAGGTHAFGAESPSSWPVEGLALSLAPCSLTAALYVVTPEVR